MNKLFVSLLLTLGITGAANAAGNIVGDAAAGQAKTAVCGACHNPDGNSIASLVVGNAIRRGGLALDGPVGAAILTHRPDVADLVFQ